MVESFCSKYFHAEEKITLVNLHSTKQLIEEDLAKYIHRFRDVSLDCHVKYQEGELVEVCIDNMLPEFRAYLENLDITRLPLYSKRLEKRLFLLNPKLRKAEIRRVHRRLLLCLLQLQPVAANEKTQQRRSMRSHLYCLLQLKK